MLMAHVSRLSVLADKRLRTCEDDTLNDMLHVLFLLFVILPKL